MLLLLLGPITVVVAAEVPAVHLLRALENRIAGTVMLLLLRQLLLLVILLPSMVVASCV